MTIATKSLQTESRVTPTVSQVHLGLVLAAELSRNNSKDIQILDMGCGGGSLLAYLAQWLPSQFPERRFYLRGFEVGDTGWHGENYLEETLAYLQSAVPEYPWTGRIAVSSSTDEWPYKDNSFDVIVSNQVLEHVQDHAFVFRQIRRCLKAEGVSIHLFPLKEVIYESHAHMPVVHWFQNENFRRKLMAAFAKLGFKRKYHEEMEFRGWRTIDEFSRIYSEVIGTMTNYKTEREIRQVARVEGLTASFAFSSRFLRTKLQSLIRRQPRNYTRSSWLDALGLPVFKRIASVTLSLRRN